MSQFKLYDLVLLLLNHSKFLFRFLFLIGLFLWAIPSFSQTREELNKRRKQLLTEIEEASRLLSLTKKDKKTTLDQYYTIQRQVRQRQELIETLEQEIALSNQSMERTTKVIYALQADMERLETEYGIMARQAYRHKIGDNNLQFLLSADGLSDGLRRWRYIQQYNDYRKKQTTLILDTRTVLTQKLNGLEIKKVEQQDLLTTTESQQVILQKEMQQKSTILQNLKADEARISRLINRKRVAHQKLSKAIEQIISQQIEERIGANRINTSPSGKNNNKSKTSIDSEENIKRLTKNFQEQKGHLSWPVSNGIITRHFGKQQHPIHKQVQITNNGIDIKVTSNNKVVAIYGGEIAGIQFVPGFQNTLIIQHGEYYSVYSNLATVKVKKGTVVGKGQFLGFAGENSQNDFLEVHLEIWKGKRRLNPALWLEK